MASIKKNVGVNGEISYRVRACVGRDATGRQVWRTCTMQRPDGDLTPKKEEKEIERLAADWEKEQRKQYEQTHVKEDLNKISFARFVNEYWLPLDVHDGKHKPNTIAFYEREAADIASYFNNKEISKITVADAKKYITYLRSDATKKDGKPYSASSICHLFKTLTSILESARRMKIIPYNPIDDLRPGEKPHEDPNRQIDYLRPEEAQRFIECLNNEPTFWRAFFMTLVFTGIRRGECCGLQWQDLNDDHTLTIARNVARDPAAEGKQSVAAPKNGKTRIVPVVSEVYDLLLQWKAEQAAQYGGLLPTAYIFGRAENPYMPMYVTSPTRWLSRFVKRNNLPEISPHDLRHTFATLSLRSGANMATISKTLGHSNIQITVKNYAETMMETQREAAEGAASIILNRKQA